MNPKAQIDIFRNNQLSGSHALPDNDNAVTTFGRNKQDNIQLNVIPSTLQGFLKITSTAQGHEIVMLIDPPTNFVVLLDGAPFILGVAQPLHHGSVIQLGPSLQCRYSVTALTVTPGGATIIEPLPSQNPRPQQLHPQVDNPTKRISKYLQLLPGIFQDQRPQAKHEHSDQDRTDFLNRYLLIFETIWEPLETRQDHIDAYFDPRMAPARFLPWLASWFDMELSPHWPEPSRRELIAHAAFLDQHRGTRIGLRDALRHAFNCQAEITDDPKQPFVFRVRLAENPDEPINRSLLEQVIHQYKPAHAGYVLEIQTLPVLTTEHPEASTQPESGGQQSREA
jgi:phage tail-like protein